MSAMVSQITSLTIVYSTINSRRRSKKTPKLRVTGLCAGTSTVTGEFPSQRPVTRSFDVFFDLRPDKRFSNNREAGDLRSHRAHYDVTVISINGGVEY